RRSQPSTASATCRFATGPGDSPPDLANGDSSDAPAPRPIGRRRAHAGGDGVVPDVRVRALEMPLVAYDLRVEAVLEEVADAAVPGVELLRVGSLEPLHPLRELLELTAHEQVIVRRHQTIGEARPPELSDDPPQALEEAVAVAVIVEDLAARDAARGDVVDAGRGGRSLRGRRGMR